MLCVAVNLNPYKLARGLLRKVVLPLGVRVHENTPVKDVEYNKDGSVRLRVGGAKQGEEHTVCFCSWSVCITCALPVVVNC